MMIKYNPIIYDSSFGYDFGFLIEKAKDNQYFCDDCNYHIWLITGMVYGELYVDDFEILEYTQENFTKVLKKYGMRCSFDYNQMLEKIKSEVLIHKNKYGNNNQ